MGPGIHQRAERGLEVLRPDPPVLPVFLREAHSGGHDPGGCGFQPLQGHCGSGAVHGQRRRCGGPGGLCGGWRDPDHRLYERHCGPKRQCAPGRLPGPPAEALRGVGRGDRRSGPGTVQHPALCRRRREQVRAAVRHSAPGGRPGHCQLWRGLLRGHAGSHPEQLRQRCGVLCGNAAGSRRPGKNSGPVCPGWRPCALDPGRDSAGSGPPGEGWHGVLVYSEPDGAASASAGELPGRDGRAYRRGGGRPAEAL